MAGEFVRRVFHWHWEQLVVNFRGHCAINLHVSINRVHNKHCVVAVVLDAHVSVCVDVVTNLPLVN